MPQRNAGACSLTVNNPYTPPSAEVADASPAPRLRPAAVNYALLLIGGALLLQLLVQLWVVQRGGFQFGDPRAMALSIGLFALYGFLCFQLAQGRNWARVVLLILTVGGFLATCYTVGFLLKQSPDQVDILYSPIFLFNRLLPILMNLGALHLLYFSSGSWFREPQ